MGRASLQVVLSGLPPAQKRLLAVSGLEKGMTEITKEEKLGA